MAKNKVELSGELSFDAKTITSSNGNEFVKLTLKISREKGKGFDSPSVVVFGDLVALAKTLKKGDEIELVGVINTSSYNDKSGVKVYNTSVIANQLTKIESNDSFESHDDFSGGSNDSDETPF